DLTGVIQALEGPPHRFHVVLVHGLVGAAEIHPAADPVDSVFPFVTGLDHIGPAGVDVLLEADLGADITAVADAELLFSEDFGRQPVTVPAPDPFHTAALHRPITRYGVLGHAGQQRSQMWHPRYERWAVIEDIGVFAWALFDGFLEGLVRLPVFDQVLFILQRPPARLFLELHGYDYNRLDA